MVLIALATIEASARAVEAQTIPKAWHQPLTDREKTWTSQTIRAVESAPDFPRLAAPVHVPLNTPPEKQINAWESEKQITIPVEMIRFLAGDASALAFVVAHEAGHAKQEEEYGESCYTAGNVQFSTFDWFRSLTDVAGAALQGLRAGGSRGPLGASEVALAIAQKQACEDNADAWAIYFLRHTRGADLNGAVRFFNKLTDYRWQPLTTQFTSDHSIDIVRIGHVTALMLQKE